MYDFPISLISKVKDTITRYALLEAGDRVIVGLSGGADSVALLSILTRLGYDCVAAHCNFGLRGDESERDMQHARKIAAQLGCEVVVTRFDVANRCRTTGESVEMACRELRYDWFDKLLVEKGAQAIAVGHHRQDNIETILLNLFRSTGLKGLCGIRHRRGNIIRPLLDVGHSELVAYLMSIDVGYVVDSSNNSDEYQRNKLRNNILPTLMLNFPKADDAILNTAAHLTETLLLLDAAIEKWRDDFVDSKGRIDVSSMCRVLGVANATTLLFEFLKDQGVSITICSDIINSATESGLKFEGRGGVVYRLDRGLLYKYDCLNQDSEAIYDINLEQDITEPLPIAISRHDISEFKPERDPRVAYLDISALDDGHVWTIRHWQQGDRMKPYGMKGSKLLSDIFSDAKFDAEQKSRQWILVCDGEPAWIVGLRASRLFEVTAKTKEYLKLVTL